MGRLDEIEARLDEAVKDYRKIFPEPYELPYNLKIAAEEIPPLLDVARLVQSLRTVHPIGPYGEGYNFAIEQIKLYAEQALSGSWRTP